MNVGGHEMAPRTPQTRVRAVNPWGVLPTLRGRAANT
jgi:hypothetical protein